MHPKYSSMFIWNRIEDLLLKFDHTSQNQTNQNEVTCLLSFLRNIMYVFSYNFLTNLIINLWYICVIETILTLDNLMIEFWWTK